MDAFPLAGALVSPRKGPTGRRAQRDAAATPPPLPLFDNKPVPDGMATVRAIRAFLHELRELHARPGWYLDLPAQLAVYEKKARILSEIAEFPHHAEALPLAALAWRKVKELRAQIAAASQAAGEGPRP